MSNRNEFETSHDAGRSGPFLVGLLCGAAAGAALGLLFAPKSGVRLRRQIARKADSLRRDAVDAYDGASEAIASVVDRSRDAIDDVVSFGRDAVNDVVDRGHDAAEKGRHAVERGKDAYKRARAETTPAAARPHGTS